MVTKIQFDSKGQTFLYFIVSQKPYYVVPMLIIVASTAKLLFAYKASAVVDKQFKTKLANRESSPDLQVNVI